MELKEQVLLGACQLPNDDDERFQASIEELKSLTETAQGEVIQVVVQKRQKRNPALYFGSGKVEEMKALVDQLKIDLVIINDELSPSQLRNLNIELGVRIIDRTQLILDIFAKRAQTKEGKLQVELAQLQYILPRLHGQGKSLSRLGGGIGTRGPGETKLESDRRHIRRRIDEIKRQLDTVVKQRNQYRQRRKQNQAFQIAIVGYTNAGKSTLFNRITNSNAFEENLLFATLDPLTRSIKLPSGFQVLVTDTVGFIEDLPTTLVAAFRSTLEEVAEADFILHVVDSSHPDSLQHEKTVNKLMKELKADHLPSLTVYNKKDLLQDTFIAHSFPSISISAYDPADVKRLLSRIEEVIKENWVLYQTDIDVSNGNLLTELERNSLIIDRDYNEELDSFFVKGYIDAAHPLYYQMKQT